MNKPSPPNQGPAHPWNDDIRPIVAVRGSDRSAWWFAGLIVIAGLLLFAALEARRRAADPTGQSPTVSLAPEAIPDLVLPTEPARTDVSPDGAGSWPLPYAGQPPSSRPAAAPYPAVPRPVRTFQPAYAPIEPPMVLPAQPLPPAGAQGISGGPPPSGSQRVAAAGSLTPSTPRIMASRLENPSTTVVQGTLINAVLETALDSTRAGQARALVTRDIHGFDGTKILIPRGTRLYGTYQSDLAQGQKRADVRWTRLLRPDGVTIALDSPAADPLGRAGVEGRVNNHIFQRIGNALLGTTANIGSALVTRSIVSSSPVVVALPGAGQSVSQVVAPGSAQISPTLTVRQGTRVSVFVQHDLDFSSVDAAP